MNRKFLYLAGGALVVLIILIVALISCSSQNKNKNQEITLTFWNLDDDKSVFEKAINDFQTANKNIKIEYVKKDSKDYLNNVLQEIAAGRGPDVLAVPNDWLPKYHSLLTAMPENKIANKKAKKSDIDVYKDTFPQVVVQDNIIDQKIYGMPLAIDTLKLYSNPNIFSQALDDYRKIKEINETTRRIFSNGPKNWDEFSQIVKIITKNSGSEITRSAAAIGTSDNVNQSVDILTLMMLQNGAKMTSDDKTAALFHTNQNQFGEIESPGTKALEFYTSFANPESNNYTWNLSMSEAARAFAEEKTAMFISYSSDKNEIKRINPNLNFSMIDIPQVKETANPVNFASYVTYAVNRTSANSTLAWDFIIFATNKENAADYVAAVKKPSARLDKISQDSPALTAANWFKPDPQKANTVFQDMIKQVNSGQAAQTAIEGAAAQISNLLAELKK